MTKTFPFRQLPLSFKHFFALLSCDNKIQSLKDIKQGGLSMKDQKKPNKPSPGIVIAFIGVWIAYSWGEINGIMSVSDKTFKEVFSMNFSKLDLLVLGLFALSLSITVYKIIKNKK